MNTKLAFVFLIKSTFSYFRNFKIKNEKIT